MALSVLVVDDERNIRLTLPALVQSFGHEAHAAQSAVEALAALDARRFDVVLLDLKIGQTSGLDLLPKLLEKAPGLAIVLMTAFATIPTAVEAIRRGARDYLPKPFEPEQIKLLLDEIQRERMLRFRVAELEDRLRDVPEAEFETASPIMASIYDMARRVAKAEAPVLLRGESGTGKGVLARLIHASSARADGPFVVVNCPTLSDELLASELFGHVRGAFTGAVRDAVGRVELAHGGTLFLDELGEMSPGNQARILRFLQDQTFERVGDGHTRRANVRLIAATNRDLMDAVRAGRFREDLLYRLNVVELTLPPLRERREDIVPLAERYLGHFSRVQQRPGMRFSAGVAARLAAHRWPGNLRELRNAVERAVILSPSDVLDEALFPGAVPEGLALGADVPLEMIEKEHILRVLARHDSVEEAARILQIDPATLWRKRKRWE